MPFSYFNRNIPDEAHQKIGEMGPAGVQAFAFTPSGGWVLVTSNGHFARGIPDECFAKLGEFKAAGHRIRVIAFPPPGGNRWLIVTDKTYFARNIPDECYAKIGDFWKAGAKPTCVAFPYPGGNRWVILAGASYFARSIDDECFQHIQNFAQGLRPAERVAFTKSGGWTILAKDRYWARNIPDECYDQMGNFSRAGLLVDHVNFAPNGGFSVISNTKRPAYQADKLRDLEGTILKVGGNWKDIWQRMAAYNTPGVSVAVVLNNQLAWATSYGRVEKNSSNWVHNDTVFQAASCSKPVAGIGFLRLVQSNKITLDADVNPKLGWALPLRACAQNSWKSKVTLRRLLRHKGGIIGRDASNPANKCTGFDDGGGGGFSGYPNVTGVGVPNLKEILNGVSNRAGVVVNSHKVELVYDPGSMSAYSGEAFVMMMQLLENQRGQKFADWMQTNVLDKAGMSHSTYALTAPPFSGPPTSGHDGNGTVIIGKRNRYPESSAAGLYTTSADLARFIIAINQGGTIDGKEILNSTWTTEMLKKSLGMPASGYGSNNSTFSHNGANAGYRCIFGGYPGRKAGYAIMTNADQGDSLYGEIAAAIKRVYGWP